MSSIPLLDETDYSLYGSLSKREIDSLFAPLLEEEKPPQSKHGVFGRMPATATTKPSKSSIDHSTDSWSDDELTDGNDDKGCRNLFIDGPVRPVERTSEHPWQHYYEKFNRKKNEYENEDSKLGSFLASYEIHEAHEFRMKTLDWWQWQNNENSYEYDDHRNGGFSFASNRKLGRLQKPSFQTNKPHGIFAYYRVVEKKGPNFILTPVHREIAGADRGDLHKIHLNHHAIDLLNPSSNIMKSLLPGDILAVSLLKPSRAAREDYEAELKSSHPNCTHSDKFEPLWNVVKFVIMLRNIRRNVIATIYKIREWEGAEVWLLGTGIAQLIQGKRSSFPPGSVLKDHIFTCQVFMPYPNVDRFCSGLEDPSSIHALQELAAANIMQLPTPPPSLMNVTRTPSDIFKTFQDKSHNSTASLKNLSILMAWAASATTAIENDHDAKVYMTNYTVVKFDAGKDAKITFHLEKILELCIPYELWRPGKKIKLILTSVTIQAQILTAIPILRFENKKRSSSSSSSSGKLLVTARIPSVYAEPNRQLILDPEIQKKALVTQVYNTNAEADPIFQFLNSNALEAISQSSIGYRLISKLFGEGSPLDAEALPIPPPPPIKFFSAGADLIRLSVDQSQYVSTVLSSDIPASVVNCPFSSGKTFSMVVAAQEAVRKDRKIHLLIGATNRNVGKIAKAAAKLETSNGYSSRIVRLISKENHKLMKEEEKSKYDLPTLMDTTFKELVLEYDRELQNDSGCRFDLDDAEMRDIEIAMNYCAINRILTPSNFMNDEAVELFVRKNRDDMPHVFFIRTFMKVYNPSIILGTISSAIALLTSTWKRLADSLETIQIDKAAQVPLCDLIATFAAFPNCRFAMLGDIHQFPPFAHPDNTPLVNHHAIGQPFELYIHKKLLPIINFSEVYRCHPEIVNLLGESFYGGKLMRSQAVASSSNKLAEMGSFWPNPNFPILFVSTFFESVPVGKSLHSPKELHLSGIYQSRLKSVFPEDQIGICALYKAQADRIALSNLANDVFVGTAEAFQGRVKDAIIICTTRNDDQNRRNFLGDVKRANAALSRARQVIIIIGNENCLGEPWKRIIEKTKEAGNCI